MAERYHRVYGGLAIRHQVMEKVVNSFSQIKKIYSIYSFVFYSWFCSNIPEK